MSLVFWLSFGAGSVYSLRKELNKPLGFGLPTAYMTSVTLLSSLRALGDKEGIIHPEELRRFPKTLVASVIATGTFFCLGHLFTKMAYPVFTDDVPMTSSKLIHT